MNFGSFRIYPAPRQIKARIVEGAQIVSNDILLNLLKFSKSIDEFHFFLPSHHVVKQLKPLNLNDFDKSIFIHHELKIKSFNLDNFIFHSFNPDLFRLSSLRLASSKMFPITGITHSLGISSLIKDISFLTSSNISYSCDSIICSSPSAKKIISSFFPSSSPIRFDHIPFGVDIEKFRPRNRQELRNSFNLPSDKVIFLCLGRIDQSYKMDLFPLINIFKDLPDSFLIIAGQAKTSDYSNTLSYYLKENNISNVKIIKDVSDDIKPLLYSASDVFVSPSDNIQETFGVALLEALSSGLPCVVSDWNGYRDLINKDVGFLIPTFWSDCFSEISSYSDVFDFRNVHLQLSQSVAVDIVLLKEKISLLSSDGSLRNNLSKNARDYALKNFDWKLIIPKFEALWKELFETSKSLTLKDHPSPNLFNIFNSYPSIILEKIPSYEITGFGKNTNITDFINKYNFLHNDMLDLQLLKKLLNKEPVDSSQKTFYNFMWLLKQGLLKKQNI